MLFANFLVSCCRAQPPAFSYGYGIRLSVTFLWLVQYFCGTWIYVLHIKHALGIY